MARVGPQRHRKKKKYVPILTMEGALPLGFTYACSLHSKAQQWLDRRHYAHYGTEENSKRKTGSIKATGSRSFRHQPVPLTISNPVGEELYRCDLQPSPKNTHCHLYNALRVLQM